MRHGVTHSLIYQIQLRIRQHLNKICLFVWLILYVLVNNISVTSGQIFLVWTSTKLGLMCLAQRHNAVTPVRLEPADTSSQDKKEEIFILPCASLYDSYPNSAVAKQSTILQEKYMWLIETTHNMPLSCYLFGGSVLVVLSSSLSHIWFH